MKSVMGLRFLVIATFSPVIASIWVTWNRQGTVQYGFINFTGSHSAAVNVCEETNFTNLITLRSRGKDTSDLTEAFRAYQYAGNKLSNENTSSFWLGTTREYKDVINSTPGPRETHCSPQWRHYDNAVVNYTNWAHHFPNNRPDFNCAVVTRVCSQSCVWSWQNRACENSAHIEITVCEHRGNRNTFEHIEDLINSNHSLTTHTLEKFSASVLDVFYEKPLNYSQLFQGTHILMKLSERDTDVEVSHDTVKNVLQASQIQHDFIEDHLQTVSVHNRENIAKVLERFLYRVVFNETERIARFSTRSFLAEVQLIEEGRTTNPITFRTTDDAAVYITIPQSAINRLDSTSRKNKTRLSFLRYKDSLLFPSEFNVSQIILAQINGQEHTSLRNPVTYSIALPERHSKEKIRYIQCVAWNFSISAWSGQGCYLSANTNPPICSCNHLTNFAILVQIVRRPVYTLFNAFNKIIGSISCIGFFLTVLIYSAFSELRRSKPGPIHINLCFCYGIAYFIFIIGSDQTDAEIPCLVATILSHYFFLAGWFWTSMEAYTMYLLFVCKMKTLGKNFFLHLWIVSYLIPFVIVAMNVGLTVGYYDRLPVDTFVRSSDSMLFNSSYVSNYYCWLTKYSLYFGFLAEGGILLGINIFVYIYVLRAITCGRQKMQSTRMDQTTAENVSRAIAIGFMLGLVWILAIPMELLAYSSVLVEPVTYLFSVLIATQGIITFYLFCVRPVRTRRMWVNAVSDFFRSCCFRINNVEGILSFFQTNDSLMLRARSRRLSNGRSSSNVSVRESKH
ncbi:unnamed protein product [Clavelina lepadiformis]|uniref:Uncharacterized protein n=1 Tax=Clavelina lepadiformis TaxID=159417 RepID=A0ABP0GGZ2_CLALP